MSVGPVAFRYPAAFVTRSAAQFATVVPSEAPAALPKRAPQGDPSRVLALMGNNALLTLRIS